MNADVRALGLMRSMDIFMYVLYSDDQNFVRDMVTKVTLEVAEEHACPELKTLLTHDSPQLYRCLFFLLLDCHPKFRYWALEDTSIGLQPVCPHKAMRFLKSLNMNIALRFLINETLRLDDLDRDLKIEYIRS